jgi:hypothetical protein
MLIDFNPASYDSGGNLLVPRYGIRIAFGVAFLTACSFSLFNYLGDKQWHHQHPGPGAGGFADPLWMVVLWIALPLAPFVLSWLLISARVEEGIAAGAGIAAALFVCLLILSIATFFGSLFLRFYQDSYDLPVAVSILVFIASSLWVIVSAFRIGAKAGWGIFLLAAGGTLFCMALIYHFLENTDRKLDRLYEQHRSQTELTSEQTNYDAQHILSRLAGCLIEYHATHPGTGFPASLDALPHDLQLPGGTVCNATITGDSSVPNYRFTYTAVRDSSASTFNDFRLVAMPLRKGLPHVDPIAVDGRGRIFSYIGWSLPDRREPGFPPPLVQTPDDLRLSHLLSLRTAIRSFVQDNGGKLPASLSDLGWVSTEADGQNETLQEGPYELSYFPQLVGTSPRYTASSVCQSYGEACIRSFFIDDDGEVHQTSEPRRATAHDPLIPDCEKYAQACRDIDWPLP